MNQEEPNSCMLRILPPELQAEANRVALEENPDNMPIETEGASEKELAALIGKRWKPGKTIKVYFMDGDPLVQANVEKYAHQWEQYANIKFSFVRDPNAEIRISFKYKGSWSLLGTDCLLAPKNEPTMNFGWFTPSTSPEEYSRTVLHEFGHALGCPHEHSSPTANIPWDKEAVYRYYMGPPNNWTKREIDYNLFYKYTFREAFATAFDPKSIMVYPIPNSQTIGDFEVKRNTVLSEMDKQFISRMYPAGNQAEWPLTTAGVGVRAADPHQ
ncbi:Tolloid-like protein 1 [Paenibacillus oralis]|uniref:Tolloid-like protein 1 n=1 Tax=Paenibacillus oralis TaxID=2490856 RepID=UPI0015A7A0F0|nr:Tolloid-like protein 1 [Paenibacillus oralis]